MELRDLNADTLRAADKFPCPGCAAPLVEIRGFGFHEADPLAIELWARSHRGGETLMSRPHLYHETYSVACTVRALTLAVRSLDAGLRDAAMIREGRAALIDARLERLFVQLTDALPRLGLSPDANQPRPSRWTGDPLMGNCCVHGVRVDEPCAKCDAATSFCPPPCGARQDQPPAAHRGCPFALPAAGSAVRPCPTCKHLSAEECADNGCSCPCPGRGDCPHGFIGACPDCEGSGEPSPPGGAHV